MIITHNVQKKEPRFLGAPVETHRRASQKKLYDYSILTLSRFSDDSSAGVKLSLVLTIPNGVNLCELDDHFNDEPYPEEPDHEIDIDDNEVGDITINPVHLPRSRQC